jgi:hypothetical protein
MVEPIGNIYNYCDRWCEKCPLTGSCSLYASYSKLPYQRINPGCESSESFLEPDLYSILQQLTNTIKKLENDTALPTLADSSQFQKNKSALAKHPLTQMAGSYAQMVADWIEENRVSIPHSTKEYIEIVEWYQYLIGLKLQKSLWTKMANPQKTCNNTDGIAKIALIAMQSSSTAWAAIYAICNDDKILDLLALLERMTHTSQTEFPNAPKFMRPGFDT